jgi:hypothetical protein
MQRRRVLISALSFAFPRPAGADEVGRVIRSESGHLFRSEAGHFGQTEAKPRRWGMVSVAPKPDVALRDAPACEEAADSERGHNRANTIEAGVDRRDPVAPKSPESQGRQQGDAFDHRADRNLGLPHLADDDFCGGRREVASVEKDGKAEIAILSEVKALRIALVRDRKFGAFVGGCPFAEGPIARPSERVPCIVTLPLSQGTDDWP